MNKCSNMKGSRECGPAAEWEWRHGHNDQGEG